MDTVQEFFWPFFFTKQIFLANLNKRKIFENLKVLENMKLKFHANIFIVHTRAGRSCQKPVFYT